MTQCDFPHGCCQNTCSKCEPSALADINRTWLYSKLKQLKLWFSPDNTEDTASLLKQTLLEGQQMLLLIAGIVGVVESNTFFSLTNWPSHLHSYSIPLTCSTSSLKCDQSSLTMSESSSSSSQCLSAARGSPTTLSSPITPCYTTEHGVFDVWWCQDITCSHTHAQTVSYFEHINMGVYLGTFGDISQGIPHFLKITESLDVSSFSPCLWSALLSTICSHTGCSHWWMFECYLPAYHRPISSVCGGGFCAAELHVCEVHIAALRLWLWR